MDFYVVAICEYQMCRGGPEEGGWWYDEYEPATDPGLAIHTKVFLDYDEAVKKLRSLVSICKGYNMRSYPYEYSSVCGGLEMRPHLFENEYPRHGYSPEGEDGGRPHYC